MGPDLSRARRAARRATRLQAPAPDRLAPVIVALDFAGSAEALALVDALGDACTSYKVGLQLLTEAGPDVVRALVARGKAVFLDLKLHEIPHSVAGAVRAAGKLGAGMVTVHASAGSAVLRAAVAAAAEHPRLQVLALTVITSLTDRDLPEIGLAPSVQQQVRDAGHGRGHHANPVRGAGRGHQVRHGAEAVRIGQAGAAELHDADGAGLHGGSGQTKKPRVGFAGLRSEVGIQVRCPARQCAWWW